MPPLNDRAIGERLRQRSHASSHRSSANYARSRAATNAELVMIIPGIAELLGLTIASEIGGTTGRRHESIRDRVVLNEHQIALAQHVEHPRRASRTIDASVASVQQQRRESAGGRCHAHVGRGRRGRVLAHAENRVLQTVQARLKPSRQLSTVSVVTDLS
jgi:hypothetical protein